MKGRVTLIGAGPSRDLITLRGLERIKRADVIVYDDLIDDRILSEASKECEKIYVGKRFGKHSMKQEQINAILIEKCRQGKEVVRLKGGDAFVFGRGGEEALAFMEEGQAWEYIPGVSSAIAVPGAMGIPVTHRRLARSFTVITGHTMDDTDEDYATLAKLQGTLVFLMGLSSISQITAKLLENKMAPDTPAAILCKGFSAGEKRIDGTLETIADQSKDAESPAILVIGRVAGMRLCNERTDPLAGMTVTVAGTDRFIRKVGSLLEKEGALVFGTEAIVIRETPAGIPEDPGTYNWLAFTSSNGIRVFFNEMKKRNYDFRRLGKVKIACIGTGTAETLSGYGLYADLIPNAFTAKDLGCALSKAMSPGENLLILRAENGSDKLNAELDQAGTLYTDEKIYESIPALDISDEAGSLVDTDYLVFGSAAGVRAFFKNRQVAPHTKVICIGEITEAEALKYTTVFKSAKTHTAEGILEILKKERKILWQEYCTESESDPGIRNL
jgi:uroporphyrinogen III methyltransferase/synthase